MKRIYKGYSINRCQFNTPGKRWFTVSRMHGYLWANTLKGLKELITAEKAALND